MSSSRNLMNILLRNVRLLDEDSVTDLLHNYSRYLSSLNNYFEYEGGVIYLDKLMAYVFGDIHGDIISLVALLEKINFHKHLKEGGYLIFLGDYIDRGVYQVETINFLLLLQLQFKNQIILLRGNHEPPRWLLPYPHDFPVYLRSRYPENWKQLYETYIDIFQFMPHIVYSKSGIFMVHGGIFHKTLDLALYRNPEKNILTEVLWNDPIEGLGIRPSYRGVGYLWGEDITESFLKKNNLKLIMRGHEACNGYMWKHSHRVLTLFSRLGPPYNNTKASIAKVNLDKWISPIDNDIVSITIDEHPSL